MATKTIDLGSKNTVDFAGGETLLTVTVKTYLKGISFFNQTAVAITLNLTIKGVTVFTSMPVPAVADGGSLSLSYEGPGYPLEIGETIHATASATGLNVQIFGAEVT